MCMAHSQVHTWMVSCAVFLKDKGRGSEVGFAFSCDIRFPWCLIPILCWHSLAHRNTRWCQPQEWGPLGNSWACGDHGVLGSVGRGGTRWLKIRRDCTSPSQSRLVMLICEYVQYTHTQTHTQTHTEMHTLTNTKYTLLPLNFASFFISCLCLLIKVLLAAAAAEVPGVQNAQ